MGISEKIREHYHPTIDEYGKILGGQRDYFGRLTLIESQVDFSGKKVLDLGCSGGFFTFSIAKKAKTVTAVDADPHIIRINRDYSDKLGFKNVEFICGGITEELIRSMGKYDVVLFLSVFHHIIAKSNTYDWTENHTEMEITGVLNAIKDASDILVFEMGKPDECFDWCDNLQKVVGDPKEWVPRHIFGQGYRQMSVLPGAAYQRWPFSLYPRLRHFVFKTRAGRKICRRVGIDVRDFREIYVGWK